MTADFFIKPLQGSQFKKFRDQIMNIQEDAPAITCALDHRSVLEQLDSMSNVHMTGGWTMVHSKKLRKQMTRKLNGKIPFKTHG
jgi:hypothetical protein